MGIFKKEERLETRTISGQELIQVLGYYARRMRQAIDMNTYTAETAAMDLNITWFNLMKWDLSIIQGRHARKVRLDLMHVMLRFIYGEEVVYYSLGRNFMQYARMDGCRIADITGGIEVFPEVLEILDSNL
ncbi:MAG: hypothetical protein ACLTST_07930 [Lachnospiraceae bacterium]